MAKDALISRDDEPDRIVVSLDARDLAHTIDVA